MRRWWWIGMLMMGCSGGSTPEHAPDRAPATPDRTPATPDPDPATPDPEPATPEPATPGTAPAPTTSPIALHFAWPAPARAEVQVVSEHDFGDGVLVSATYRYQLAVRRDDAGYVVSRSGLELVQHTGDEPLRLGNVIAQDVTQHVGDLRCDADGTHIAAVGGYEPIEAAAHAALADAGLSPALADAVLALGQGGWEVLNVVDYDTLIHEWNGRSFTLGVIQPADAIADVSATRIVSRASAPCDETSSALTTCVELVRTEDGQRAGDRIEHVYTLLAEPDTLRPHRFQHESRTDSESASVHYAETWTTTFTWR